uniref:Hsp20/alpha crystallin family protein n=1 Tax=Caldiarchaeum subterraneum TaxID=311458 RepID=A0A7C5LCS4_CALS0
MTMSTSPWEWIRRLQKRVEAEMEEAMRLIKEVESRTGCIMPLYNVVETEDMYVVTVDMPGVKRDEIELQVFENQLAIEAPCRSDLPSRRYGNKYKVLIDLPRPINPEQVKARYVQGVLEVRVSKKAGRGVRIPVE